MKNLNALDLIELDKLLLNGQQALAYRLVNASSMTPSNRFNINSISVERGVTYTYGPHEDGRKYWKAIYY